MDYVKPHIVTHSSRVLVEALGPAVALQSGLGSPEDIIAPVWSSPNSTKLAR